MRSFGAQRATGYATWDDGTTQGKVECDTFTCWHCNTVVFVPTQQAQRLMVGNHGNAVLPFGHCRLCDRPICAACADAGSCTPFERKLERIEAADRLHRQIGGAWR